MKVTEIFVSLQGEGRYAGVPSVFLRLAGCNRRCKRDGKLICDTQYSLSLTSGNEMSVDEVAKKVMSYEIPRLVVSGGEPLWDPHRQELGSLIKKLSPPMDIEIETNGDFPPLDLDQAYVFYTVSPKFLYGPPTPQETVEEMKKALADFKFVVKSREDVESVRNFVESFGIPNFRVFLMPFSRSRREYLRGLKEVFELCVQYKYNFSPRLHIEAFDRKKGV